ncbi:MAG: hypothetical protein C4547_06395 [Phycisphaerales bacterium]|nr:MAG: hypothetical protein C4547_06395 [Phycisphaerales bacterium]
MTSRKPHRRTLGVYAACSQAERPRTPAGAGCKPKSPCWAAAATLLACTVLFHASGCSRSGRQAQRAEVTARFADLRAETDRMGARFEFDRAEAALAAFREEVRAAGLESSELAAAVSEAIAAVAEARASHQALLAAGYVVFEGRVIEGARRDEIVAEREAAARQEAAAAAAREAALDRIAEAAARGSDVNWRVRPQLQVQEYVEQAQRRHAAAIERLKRLIPNSGRGGIERDGWQRELDALRGHGPHPLYFGEAGNGDGSRWNFEYGRLGYLRDPIVVDILDTWKSVVTAGTERVIVARFATIHLRVGKPVPPPATMFEVVGVETWASPAGPRLIVVEPFSIGPHRSDLPPSTIVE